jgi:hypothetical protein
MQISMTFYGAAPTLVEPELYGRVDRSVVPVLRAIHARQDAEMEQRRRDADIEAYKRQQKLMAEAITTEKEIQADCNSWWKSIFKKWKGEQ